MTGDDRTIDAGTDTAVDIALGTAIDATATGRYALGPEIGRGSTAVVHRALDRVTGEDVAVKVFTAVATEPGGRDQREIGLLTGLRHPGLVTFRDSGTADDHVFVVMDLVDGRSLATALGEGPLPAPTAAALGAELADTLAHVHDQGIVHRDVKPANILLDEQERPRLADFGIARLDGATRMTETGVVIGTAAYMAPEQVRGVGVGPATDVYALGLVLLEAVTGLREYPGAAVESAIARLHRAPIVPSGLPDRFAATLRRMTATEPARRPTAAEVAALLGGAEAPAASRSRRRLVTAAAAAVLVAGALGGWIAFQPSSDAATTSGADAPTVVEQATPPTAVPEPAVVAPEPAAAAASRSSNRAPAASGASAHHGSATPPRPAVSAPASTQAVAPVAEADPAPVTQAVTAPVVDDAATAPDPAAAAPDAATGDDGKDSGKGAGDTGNDNSGKGKGSGK